MQHVFITGASGNVGLQTLRFLHENTNGIKMKAGVRDTKKAKNLFNGFKNVEPVRFDFTLQETFAPALQDIDTLFLLRPPQIANVEKYIKPLIDAGIRCGVKQIVFLSVQGAEKNKFIPHHKIENLIRQTSIEFVFVRPGYFMQNLTTTLATDIQKRGKIILPAGKATFNWVDVNNIGEVTAIFIRYFDKYKNNAYEITGNQKTDFYKVAELISDETGKSVEYKNMNPLRFYLMKRREGIQRGLVLVMIMLHFLPRLKKTPALTDFYKELTGKSPTSLQEFIKREKEVFLP